jgi:prepilin-type N-terminal cleavage/methylation domain-containing protein
MLQRIRDARGLSVRDLRDEGFTLIEMLIVIVVLGILAALVVFGVSTFRSDAVASACKADVKAVEIAAEAFNAKTGAYPANMAALTGGNYLKAAPASTDYTISLAAGGVVTGTKSAANGGGAC